MSRVGRRRWQGEFVPVANGQEILKWQSETPFTNETTREFIRALGFDVVDALSCGMYGCSLLVTGIAPPHVGGRFVMKLGQIDSDEIQVAVEAAALGIGPRVYVTRETGRTLNTKRFGDVDERMIVMDTLDVTFDKLPAAEMSPALALALIELARKCVAAEFLHADLHTNNIMLDRKAARWYLVDFADSVDLRALLTRRGKSIRAEILEQWKTVFGQLEERTRLLDPPERKSLFQTMALNIAKGK